MKTKVKRISLRTLAMILGILMLVTSIAIGSVVNTHAAGPFTIYMIPKSEMANVGSTYRLNYKNTNNTWGQTSFTFTGRTVGGRPVYKTTFSPATTASYNCQLQVGEGGSFSWDLYAGSHNWSDWNGKYFDANGSGSWNNSVTFDTYKLYNGTNEVGTLTWNATSSKYTLTQQLTAGTTYKFNVYNSNYGFGSKYFQCNAKTQTSTGTTEMYAYKDRFNNAVITVTPTVTWNYTFEWTLADSQNDDSKVHVKKGSLNIVFPTLHTVSYTLGDHVNYSSVSGGVKTADGTITAEAGSDVALTVSYDTGYEYNSSTSTLGGATASNGNKTFTFSSISANKTISVNAKQSQYTVSFASNNSSYGTVSTPSSSYTNVTYGQQKSIVASPIGDYAFVNWTASPAENIEFADANSTSTTITVKGNATVTANFTNETLYNVTVNDQFATPNQKTVRAGAQYVKRTIEHADMPSDEWTFDGWAHTGGVTLVNGYNWNDEEIQINASSTGTVTAQYSKVNYIYFYAALQSDWNSDPKVTVGTSEVEVYRWLGDSNASTFTLYSNANQDSKLGGNNVYTYRVGIFRVPASSVGKSIYVYNTTPQTSNGNCGTVRNDQGWCYYTYSTTYGNNTSGSLSPQKVTAVNITESSYDADESISVTKTETKYYDNKTAGQDTYTYTYDLLDSSDNLVETLDSGLPANTAQYNFTPTAKNITISSAGNYKVRITTTDTKTGRIVNTCTSSAFEICPVPTQTTVNYSITSGEGSVVSAKYTYKNGSATNFASGSPLRAGSQVTITYQVAEGYNKSTSTVSSRTNITAPSLSEGSFNSTTRQFTVTFTLPSATNASSASSLTINQDPTEITHSVTVKRRYFDHTGNTQISVDSSAYQTLTDVGIATAKSTNDAPPAPYYTFNAFVLPDSGVTLASGQLNTSAAISVNATEDNKTIYIDYRETLNNITITTDGNGNVQRNSANITSGTTTAIGYVTAVNLTAAPSAGYKFKEWVITKNTAQHAVVGNQTYTLGNSPTTISASDAPASSNFKFDGTATLKANFVPVDYTISAGFPSGNEYSTGNKITLNKTGGSIGEKFTLSVLLAPGYKVADTNGIAFSSESGYAAPTLTSGPITSGNTVTYTYKINAGHVKATVTLEAETPTLSNVYIKNKTTLDNSYPESPYANNATIEMYYKQPVMAKATTDTFSTLNYYTYSDNSGSNVPGNSPYASVNNKGTGEDATVNADLSVRPTSENGTVNYKFEVIARNAPNGVDAKEKKYTYTIQVSFNDAQKYFFKLYRLYQKCIQETEQNNTYYKSGAPIGSYNTAYTATGSYVHDGSAQYYPDYIDTSDTTGAQTKWNTFSLAYNSLKSYAKTTTIIVLTNTNYKETSSTRPMRITAKTNGTQDDWDHFYMLTSEDNSYKSGSKEDTTHGIYTMTYDGYVTKSSVRYDVYKITYYGHIKFNIWRPDSLNDVTVETSKQITGDITGAVDYKDYYVNAYNKTVGSSSFTEISEYSDHDHTWNKKKMLEINDEKTKSYLLGSSFLNVQASGSMKSAPGIDVTAPTSITIEGPIGKAGKETKTLTNDSDTFKPTKPGKYWVKYTSIFGKTASGDNNTRTAKMAIYVATDEIDVYVDMNNNAGTPFLNFKYYVNSSGDPVTAGTSGATEANLPYEMDLATGSQSVYKYTVKISKLNGDYKLAFDLNNPIIIDYISIGDRKIGQGTGGFQLKNEARLTGEVWYKADKTNLTTFDELSYGSVNKSFIACDSENSFLSGAIKSVHGTGVIADREVEYNSSNVEVYESKYAAIYSSTINTLPSNFSYNLKATAKEEFSAGGNTYYFDKWVAVKAPDEDGDVPDIASAEDYSDNPDINFNKAVEYKEDGSSNMVYIAKYKLVSSTDTTVRVVVTYNFKDYNTEDGNYVYDANKPRLNASYTKTIKVTVGNGQTYQNFAAVRAAVDTIAKNNKPIIKSNYFDYTYDDNSGTVDTENTSESQAKIVATATFSETAHPYKIVLKDGSNSTTYDGYYQQTQKLTTSKSNPVWKDNNDNIIGTESKYVARFIASGFETDDGTSSGTDCQIIKLANDSEASADHKSIVSNSYTEQYVDGTTPKLRHNFYIIDYCNEGELVGGGVLYATHDGTNYRQANAASVLDTVANRTTFITRVLSSDFTSVTPSVANCDFDTEYLPQTIKGVGFRYKPYNFKEDVYRYSDDLKAYTTLFTGENNNTDAYEGQKLRVFSFMVYNNNNNYVIVPSEGYGEVSRYIPPTQEN